MKTPIITETKILFPVLSKAGFPLENKNVAPPTTNIKIANGGTIVNKRKFMIFTINWKISHIPHGTVLLREAHAGNNPVPVALFVSARTV